MAHTLVTQVEEPVDDHDSTAIPLGALVTQARPDDGAGANGTPGRAQPAGCWRTFMSFFCISNKQAQAQPQQQPLASVPPDQKQLVPSSSSSSQSPTPTTPVPRPPHSSSFQKYLLDPLPDPSPSASRARKCLVLDLDETLVHSSFKPIPNPDFIISIELEGVIHKVFVRKRPGVDHFLRMTAVKFELVVFTASLSKYADPLLDVLDPDGLITSRLFRESCVQHYGNFVKDLTHLGRNMSHTLIIDNSPFSYLFQPTHAVPCTSWFHDSCDLQLFEMLPFLDRIAECDDVVACIAAEKARQCHTFFGNASKQPQVHVPTWAQQQTMGVKQRAPLQHHQSEQRDPHVMAAAQAAANGGAELSQIQVAVSM